MAWYSRSQRSDRPFQTMCPYESDKLKHSHSHLFHPWYHRARYILNWFNLSRDLNNAIVPYVHGNVPTGSLDLLMSHEFSLSLSSCSAYLTWGCNKTQGDLMRTFLCVLPCTDLCVCVCAPARECVCVYVWKCTHIPMRIFNLYHCNKSSDLEFC